MFTKWKEVPEFKATWEDFATISESFPDFNLEDKMDLWVRSNVVHPPLKFTYKRKKQKKVNGGTTNDASIVVEVVEEQGKNGNMLY